MKKPVCNFLSIRSLLWLLATGLVASAPTHACTLWGAAGEAANGGTIISKNRDWKPDHVQVLQKRRGGTNQYSFLGLFAVGNKDEGLKEGVNEKGLTVVNATAGSIPESTRKAQSGRSGTMTTLLQRYATCDEILADKDSLFSGRKPMFLMISDRKKILVLEVGLNGRYAVKVVESGATAHCNHYLEPSLADCNVKIADSSATRVARINELLGAATKPFDVADFAAMSKDQHDGEDNSLWRTGTAGSRTLSSWILETPAQGAPKLRVQMANPGRPEETSVFVLDEAFWTDKRFENSVAAEKARQAARPKNKTIRVALYEGPGTGGNGPPNLMKQLHRAPDFTISAISPKQLQNGALTDYDVVIFAGGSASKQASAIGPEGREAVRQFVRNGGGYIGICAGAYLATSGSTDRRLNLLDAKTISPEWRRGRGDVEMELSADGKKILGGPAGRFSVRYANGPVVQPAGRADLTDYQALAFFRTELAENGTPAGIMVDAPSVFSGPFGRGRAAAVSPHPEQTEGLEQIVPELVSWAAGQPHLLKTESDAVAPKPDGEVEQAEISAIVRKHYPVGSEGGVAVLVVRDGKTLHRMGYGLEDGEKPITPDTPMPLASVTKQFAAMCAACLIEEGRLKLTDKVAGHLPDVRLPVLGRELLVQDLLWHISGLANFIKDKEQASIADYRKSHGLERLTNKTHAEWLATMPLLRAPGLAFEYTNSGYVLLARIIEVITGKPFHEFQQERIFDRLGMKQTSDSTTFNGSGNMRLSLHDYEKWDRALWNGSLVKPETWKLMMQSGTLDNGEPVGYGFGWRVVHENGQLVEMTHGGTGSAPGNSRNLVLRDLRNLITVVLLTRENLKVTRDQRKQMVEEIRDRARQLP